MENMLWYRQPAANFNEALPIGNGRLGAMVYGGVRCEKLSLNDDTLWSGGPQDFRLADGPGQLEKIAQAVARGDYHAADELSKKLQGPYTGSFLPMADLLIEFPDQTGEPVDYRRSLDLESALAHTEYTLDGVRFRREYFAENPSQIMLLRFDADQPGRLNCRIQLDSRLHFQLEPDGSSALWLRGEAPWLVDPNYYGRDRLEYDPDRSLRFAVRLELTLDGGSATADAGALIVSGADRLELRLSSATGFRSAFDTPVRDYQAISDRARSRLDLARDKSYRRLRSLHLADYQRLYDRCSLNLAGPDQAQRLPTDERLRRFDGSDVSLAALLFNYGRYLLISCSRRGTQPANLQGLWNELLRAPWSSNYTININTQMNYWPAEAANLGPCLEPLFDLIENLSVSGRRSAANYGCGGWVAHHNTDIWALSTMVGMGGMPESEIWWPEGGHIPQCVTWPMGGAWLCRHLYEHYLYTQDRKFLAERAYPLLRGAAEFMLDFLRPVTIRGEARLGTVPSTSPENLFLAPDGQPAAVSCTSTMDLFIVRELLGNTLAAAEVLKVDPKLATRLRETLGQLPQPHLDERNGRLCEWSENFSDAEPHHRHVSHLYGLHPAALITEETPELFAAARKTLEIRGDDGTGWSLAWKVNFWARLLDGDHAWKLLQMMFRLVDSSGEIRYDGGGGVYPNLFDAHPPFQIDGNLGVVAGMIEMLVQSHAGYFHLLPALPADWTGGELNGVRLRGNAELDLAWKKGALSAQFRPGQSGSVRFRCARPLRVFCNRQELPVAQDGEFYTFEVSAGNRYQLKAN